MRSSFVLLVLTMAASVPVMAQLETLQPDNWDQHVPAGKEVDAIYGDLPIGNDRARGIVAAATWGRKANMTVGYASGCLIDFTTRDHESDQLSAFYPGHRRYPLLHSESGPDGSIVVLARGKANRPEYRTRYHMEPGQPILNITSTWTNTTDKTITLVPEDGLRIDSGSEDMVQSPPGMTDMFRIHDLFWQQAYAVRAPGFQVRVVDTSREIVLQYVPDDEQPIELKPGAVWDFTRQLICARDLPELLAVQDDLTGLEASLATTVKVIDAGGKPLPNARIRFSSGDDERGISVADEKGEIHTRLPAGRWSAELEFAGIKLPLRNTGPIKVTEAGQELTIRAAQRIGQVQVTVRDEQGTPIPAKVQFSGVTEQQTPDWGPPSAEHFTGNVAYTASGEFTVSMLAGTYDVIVSRGPEYDAFLTRVTVTPGRLARVKARLQRSVDSTGWVSADFHSHSSPSGDNTGSQRGRVLNLAAEHIEFAPCTEHNRVSTYAHHIEELGLTSQLATVSGMELTGSPLPLNHQNAFPMKYTPRTQDGGGPRSDRSPEAQIERLAAWDDGSQKLIQQDHPDIGWLFYDQDGNGQPDQGHDRSFVHIDVMEIHPIDRVLDLKQFEERNGQVTGNHRILNWLQLLNQGFRIYGVVNTDAHYNFHGSGGLRNWIQSSTDNPADISHEEMREAAEEGRLVMSNGPFLQADFRNSEEVQVVSGQDLPAEDGVVEIDIRVQCPNWFDVDRVFVLVNGRRSAEHTFLRATHPRLFSDRDVRFEHRVRLMLTEDSHVIVATGHAVRPLGDIPGPRWGRQKPAAITNPVFVDVDGDGFRPNRDTLDFPLPVKFDGSQHNKK